MDLSKLKWLFIAILVVGGGWLVTEGGVNWVYDKATTGFTGEDASKDKVNEATLSRYGGFLLATFRYEKSKKFYETAVRRYDQGANVWWNYHQLARCEEKLENYKESADILFMLWVEDGDQHDERVPDRATLKYRIDRMVELHNLEYYEYE